MLEFIVMQMRKANREKGYWFIKSFLGNEIILLASRLHSKLISVFFFCRSSVTRSENKKKN